MGNPDPDPNRVGPSQPPIKFVDGNGYIVLRGLVEARDCEGGWNKVMKAWGSGDEKVVAKNLICCSTPGGVKVRHARDPDLPWRWQSKSSLGQGVGGPLLKKFQPSVVESVPQVAKLHLMTPGSVILASVASGSQLAHTDVATHTEVVPPLDRDISVCPLVHARIPNLVLA